MGLQLVCCWQWCSRMCGATSGDEMRHKHADLICAWANGAQIEYYDIIMCRWLDNKNPRWYEEMKFRIKPEPKPDVVLEYYAFKNGEVWERHNFHAKPNEPYIKLTFDGETGELKAAEVLK